MVKLIIDLLGTSLSEEVSKLKNTILLVPQNCQLPASVVSIFKDLADLESPLNIGNFVLKTNDDCLRGLVIGRITEKFPKVLIYSSRPEIMSKYLQSIHVEPWPNDFNSYSQLENFTMTGPPINSDVHPISSKEIPKFQIQNKNEPKIPVRSGLNEKLNPNGFGYPAAAGSQGNFLAQSSINIQGSNTPQQFNPGYGSNPFGNPNQGKPASSSSAVISNPLTKPESQNQVGLNINPNQFKSQSLYIPEAQNLKNKVPHYDQDLDLKEEEPVRSDHKIIVKYVEKVLDNFLYLSEIKTLKTYKELHQFVSRIIRGMGEENEEIIDDDKVRFKLTDEVCLKILDFGFFLGDGALKGSEIVAGRMWSTPVTYNL